MIWFFHKSTTMTQFYEVRSFKFPWFAKNLICNSSMVGNKRNTTIQQRHCHDTPPRSHDRRSLTPKCRRRYPCESPEQGYRKRSYVCSQLMDRWQRLCCSRSRSRSIPSPTHEIHRESHGSHESQWPFTSRIKSCRIPRKMEKPPFMDSYDGTTEPHEHNENVEAILDYCDTEEPIKCRIFAFILEESTGIGLRVYPRTLSTLRRSSAGNSPLSTHHLENNPIRSTHCQQLSKEKINISRTTLNVSTKKQCSLMRLTITWRCT